MANFNTHITVGILVTVVATISLNHIENVNVLTLSLMTFLGIVASMFPDIDLKTSKPFQFLKLIMYFSIPLFFIYKASINQIYFLSHFHASFETLSISIILISLVLNYMFLTLLSSLMIHRGIIHSIPFAFVTSIIVYELALTLPYHVNSLYLSLSWLIGFLTHLTLDEMYSVDLMNIKMKKSFGTALSLLKCKNLSGTLLMYLFLAFYVSTIKDYSFVGKLI